MLMWIVEDLAALVSLALFVASIIVIGAIVVY